MAYDRKPDKAVAAEEDEAEDKKTDPEPDAIRNEALRIMKDLIELNRQTKTASIQAEKECNALKKPAWSCGRSIDTASGIWKYLTLLAIRSCRLNPSNPYG